MTIGKRYAVYVVAITFSVMASTVVLWLLNFFVMFSLIFREGAEFPAYLAVLAVVSLPAIPVFKGVMSFGESCFSWGSVFLSWLASLGAAGLMMRLAATEYATVPQAIGLYAIAVLSAGFGLADFLGKKDEQAKNGAIRPRSAWEDYK